MILCFVLAISAIPSLHPSAQAISEYPPEDYELSPCGNYVFFFNEDDPFDDIFDPERFAALEYQMMVDPLSLVGNATRAEVTALLLMALAPNLLTSENTPNILNRFTDVQPRDWFYPTIAWAYRMNWAQGDGTNRFRANDTITREEFVTMAVRASGAGRLYNHNLTFRDTHRISSWARPYVNRAVQRGWIIGSPDNEFLPQHLFQREHTVIFMNRITGRQVGFPNNRRTITWNGNGGTSPAGWTRLAGSAVGSVMPANSVRPGHEFAGWFDTSLVTAGRPTTPSTIIPNHNVTYWARWNNPQRHLTRWYHNTTINFRFVNAGHIASNNQTWSSLMNTGRTNWNNIASPITFNAVNVSNNIAEVISLPNASWLGIQRSVNSNPRGRTMTQFTIELNEPVIRSEATAGSANLNNLIITVFAHELGHVLGLRDGPSGAPAGPTGSIMFLPNQTQLRQLRTTPSAFDIASVQQLYGR